jgi:hypothetical protein
MLKGMLEIPADLFFLLRGSTDHPPTFFAYRLHGRIIDPPLEKPCLKTDFTAYNDEAKGREATIHR